MVPIHFAVLKNHLPMVKWLIEHIKEEVCMLKYKEQLGLQVQDKMSKKKREKKLLAEMMSEWK